ncbi:hypothetical protein SPW_1339 [Streptomyces sp. W007]|nr:hypothetical protein SPW_1339 [Streptomyces sp. W007]
MGGVEPRTMKKHGHEKASAPRVNSRGGGLHGVVEMAGIEPASNGAEPGLLRVQFATLFSAPEVTRTSLRQAQPLFDFLLGPVAGPRSLDP